MKYILGSLFAFFLFAANLSGQTTFTNNTAITITDRGGATPQPATIYPSNITASGFSGNTTKVTVTLTSYNHIYQDDGGFLLVSPTGQKVRLMTDCGSDNTTSTAVNLTFDDTATAAPDCSALVPSGTYKPTVGLTISPSGGETHPANFPAPAPVAAYSLLLSSFNGANPNGDWSLYVDDDTNGGPGTLAGWSLTVTAPRPTVAGTTVGGRVTQQNGSGIRNARVTMLNSMGSEQFAVTDRNGLYQFEDVPSGLVYVFSVAHLRYQFEQPTQVQFIGEGTNSINFVGTSFTRFGDLLTVRNSLSKE